MAECGCTPLWEYDETGDLCGATPNHADLPLSQQTVGDLITWAAWFDTWIDMRDPYDSRRVIDEETEAFNRAGRRLWDTLQRELGDGWCVV